LPARRRLAAAERNAEREIARLRAGAAQDQIAEAGRPASVSARAPQARPSRAQFAEAARGQRGLRRGAELAADHDAGRDRQHVLGGATDLDAADVGGVIGPERRRAQRLHEAAGQLFLLRRQRHRRRQAARDVVGKARARQDRRLRVQRGFSDHLGHEFMGAVLDALGTGDDRCRSCDVRGQHVDGAAQMLRGVAISSMSARAASASSLVTTISGASRTPGSRGLSRVDAMRVACSHCAPRA
jgi:hypothetical protein